MHCKHAAGKAPPQEVFLLHGLPQVCKKIREEHVVILAEADAGRAG